MKQEEKPRKTDSTKLRLMIEQLKKFCDSTRLKVEELQKTKEEFEAKATGGLEAIRDSLLELKTEYRSSKSLIIHM